ncbi:hypothetical protein KY340_05075 [Candidatus Woesearchaeota archaeon]|nr:hypothetical protein [Candidatus Woesearchaeota archaeon]
MREVPEHTILRDDGVFKDRLKHHMFVAGLPASAFTLMNVCKASQIPFAPLVSNDHGRLILEEFNRIFNPQVRYSTKLVFVHEGLPEDWKMSGTLGKGHNAWMREFPDINPHTPLFLLNGDTPLLSRLDETVTDPDLDKYKAIMEFNCRETIFGVDFDQREDNGWWHRRYHAIEVARRLMYKEGNGIALDYLAARPFLDPGYDARKSSEKNNEKVVKKLINDVILKEGRWKTGLRLIVKHFGTLLPVAVRHTLKNYIVPETIREKHVFKHRIPFETWEDFAGFVLGGPVKIKPHSDVTKLIDIDSYEDWDMVCGLFELAEKFGYKKSDVYPHWDELQEMRSAVPGLIERGVRMADLEYIRYLFSLHTNLEGKFPYDENGNYKSKIWPEEQIRKGIEYLARMNAGFKQKELQTTTSVA